MVQGKSYDCVLLGLKVPGLNGRQLYDLIHGFNQEMASRVIFVTWDVLNPHVKDLVAEAGNPVLIKPFSLDDLRKCVIEFLGTKP